VLLLKQENVVSFSGQERWERERGRQERMDDQTEKIEHILKLNKQLLDEFPEAGPVARLEKAWLTNTLTMPQFKTLILIGHASSGQGTTVGMLAKRLQVRFPTMSVIVYRLY
jgi:DNA-binding MarR family transcriptional regulator